MTEEATGCAAKARTLRSLMLVGTASNVGKSVLCAALCRIFAQDGVRVAPFKAQNMSLNAAVTPTGGEIGRAQAVQAEAAGILANEHMNPVLLKPTGYHQSQVIVQGQAVGHVAARDYFMDDKARLWDAVCESFAYLRARYDLIVMEGAGSPVELNLKARDMANMRAAAMADAAVILVADIDRGGVFAAVLGTLALLEASERARVCGIIVNRFRGDPSLFVEGVEILEARAGLPVLGVIPYIPDLQIEEEDSVALGSERYKRHADGADQRSLQVAVVRLPRIANFTDLDPLFIEPDVDVYFTISPDDVSQADAVVLPGTKSTIADLLWLQETGLAQAICLAEQQGKYILGICGGFQMLGRRVCDPEGHESDLREASGLGLHTGLTTMAAVKRTVQVHATLMNGSNLSVDGYEIHMGETSGIAPSCAFAKIEEATGDTSLRWDGAYLAQGRVIGTYLHGILHNDQFRLGWLNGLRRTRGLAAQALTVQMEEVKQVAYDHLAAVVRANINLARIYETLDK